MYLKILMKKKSYYLNFSNKQKKSKLANTFPCCKRVVKHVSNSLNMFKVYSKETTSVKTQSTSIKTLLY